MVEAMAMGKPVVASAIAPLSEIVVNGDSGYLVEPANPNAFAEALIRLVDDPVRRNCLGQRGRERVEKLFTAERMARQTLELYQRLQRQANERRIAV
jgi:glycosyltransferase involved in cell wall biosynthesis